VVICLKRGRPTDCLYMVQLMPLNPQTPSSLASFKFSGSLVLPFWYRLTEVVLEKRPLNGGCSVVVWCECRWEMVDCTPLNIKHRTKLHDDDDGGVPLHRCKSARRRSSSHTDSRACRRGFQRCLPTASCVLSAVGNVSNCRMTNYELLR